MPYHLATPACGRYFTTASLVVTRSLQGDEAIPSHEEIAPPLARNDITHYTDTNTIYPPD